MGPSCVSALWDPHFQRLQTQESPEFSVPGTPSPDLHLYQSRALNVWLFSELLLPLETAFFQLSPVLSPPFLPSPLLCLSWWRTGCKPCFLAAWLRREGTRPLDPPCSTSWWQSLEARSPLTPSGTTHPFPFPAPHYLPTSSPLTPQL